MKDPPDKLQSINSGQYIRHSHAWPLSILNRYTKLLDDCSLKHIWVLLKVSNGKVAERSKALE